jgi:hypothetical protein
VPKAVTVAAIVVTVLAFSMIPSGFERSPAFPDPSTPGRWPAPDARESDVRRRALRAAKVWTATDPSSVDFSANPDDPSGELTQPIVRCKFVPDAATGTTTKFDCVLSTGETVKVKYGRTGEIHAELAAARLLSALGFGADQMFLVPRVRCYGCPRLPFYIMWMLDKTRARALISGALPDTAYTDFTWVSVERKFPGFEIESDRESGWAWYELDDIDGHAGASRAELDAFRLVAALLSHWDNKSVNQRLVCRSGSPRPDGSCPDPFAIIHDLGASFGPNKIDLENWEGTPIWKDRTRCLVSMKLLPFRGGTFKDTEISEGGRQLLARQLAAVSEEQAAALFTAARFHEFHRSGDAADPREWARVLKKKAAQIAQGEPCPNP